MALRMTSPCKPGKNGVYYFRKRVPADLVAAEGKTEVKFSLRTKDPAEAKKRCRDADIEVTRRWEMLRHGPQVLPLKDIMGLAGRAYSRFVEQMDRQPGEPEIWQELLARIDGEAASGNLEKWYGSTADSLLFEYGRSADAQSRERLLDEIHKAIAQAARLNKRKAQGDYSPDPKANRFPKLSSPEPDLRPDDEVSFGRLLAAWQGYRENPRPNTLREWARTIDDFKKFVGHDDAKRASKADVRRWLDYLIEEKGLSHRTAKEKKLAALRAIYRAAINKLLVENDPTDGLTISVPKRKVLRPKGFTDEEAGRILSAALDAERMGGRTSGRLKLAYRWMPWLCAYTGARGGEIAQLRSEDVRKEGAIPYIRITPEAGAVKTGIFRDVPLPPYLIEQGFIEMVTSRPRGPLFYHAARSSGDTRQPWDNVRDKVGKWTKKVGRITDASVQPTHAWRHRFKTLCRRAGIEMIYANAIQGHSEVGAAAGYGEIPLETLFREIQKLPRFPGQENIA